MASPHPPRKSLPAVAVGSYFVQLYYNALVKEPEEAHKFYFDSSAMIRVDGDSSQSASAIPQIRTLLLSLNYRRIEIKTIDSLDSWNHGLLVMVSGLIKIMGIKRKFVETFFLAPKEDGYFVLNDIFHFIDDEVINPNLVSMASENIETQRSASNSLTSVASEYSLEEEASKYVDSVHIEDDPLDKYSLPQQQQQLQQDLETENVVEETPADEVSLSIQNVMHTIHEPPVVPVEEPADEPAKKTYASLLQISKGNSFLPAAPQPSFRGAPTPSELNHAVQPAVQQSISASIPVSHSMVGPADEGFGLEEGELKSVYVRNLPATVSEAEIEQEFKYFGRIKQDGIFIRVRKEFNACYAFVEFEDILGVQNALQASPVQLAGRQVFIEERRPNSGSTATGGSNVQRWGRGRISYRTDAPRVRFGARRLGRGSNQDGGDYNRFSGYGSG